MCHYCTVTVVAPDTPKVVAVMVAVPTLRAFTFPLGLTVATASFDELQSAVCVRSCVVSSEKTPVAVSCLLSCTWRMGFAGVITIEVRTTGVTVTAVAPDTPACVAVIVVVPTRVPVTKPLGLTVARALFAEVQPTESVRSWVVRSEKTPVAVSCREVPLAREGPVGVIVIEVRTAGVTVTGVAPATPP